MLCIVIPVHKFDFRLVINETLNKWRPMGSSCRTRDSCFWQGLYIFLRL